MNIKKSISFGDKIFARVTRNGRTIYNFVSEKVADLSDLVRQLRFAIKDVSGLVMIHIRNYDKGWGEERPLMLYASKITLRPQADENIIPNSQRETRKMFFPWETH